jgi:hypothetical protein
VLCPLFFASQALRNLCRGQWDGRGKGRMKVPLTQPFAAKCCTSQSHILFKYQSLNMDRGVLEVSPVTASGGTL